MREDGYRPDEQRVCTYLQTLLSDQIGCGEDPIGFLIAQNEWWRHRAKALEVALREIANMDTVLHPMAAKATARRGLEEK